MKAFTLLTFLLIATSTIKAQIAPEKYFVRFTDKNDSPYSIDNPSAYLSQKAIERRQNQGIAIDISDLPVNPSYLEGVEATGAVLLNTSKWLNGVSVYAVDPSIINAINALSYVQSVTMANSNDGNGVRNDKSGKPFFENEIYDGMLPASLKQGYQTGAFDFGYGFNQIQMLKGDLMHEMGYRGDGMVIAVLDAGFTNAHVLDIFDSLWINGQILGTRDFVRGGEVQFNAHTHGTMVLSTMGGNVPGQLIGTAPRASYWLLRSEDGGSEYIIEEYNWVSAAEYADSVGADIINSSLGYTTFDDPGQDHTYADLDGDTAPATIGADMAAKKGILVVNSLGNEGGSSWYYLSVPSDGDSVLGIGAVDPDGEYAGFSSHGPSADDRVKPDVVAQGEDVVFVNPDSGNLRTGNGTSFSSPILAGMAACLWQANPSLSNMQIADAIRMSASQYDSPDDFLGYGIPDFLAANDILTVIDTYANANPLVNVFPNPFRESFILDLSKFEKQIDRQDNLILEVYDLTGRLLGQQNIKESSGQVKINLLETAPEGIYFIKVKSEAYQYTGKIIKG